MRYDYDEDPLGFSRREQQAIRRMIRDYERGQLRREITREWWRDGQKIAIAFAGVALYALNVVVAITALHGK